MRGRSLGWFRGAECAKHGRTALYRPSLSRKKALTRRFFPRFRARWLHGYGFGFLLFRCHRFVIRARQIFTIRMRDWVDFSRGIKTGGIHAAPARQRLFTIIAVLRTSRISLIGSPIARRCATSTSGRSPLPNISMSALNPPARNGARYRTSNHNVRYGAD